MYAPDSIAAQLRSLSLRDMAMEVERLTAQAGRDGWSHERYLRTLCDIESTKRAQRRQERLLKDSKLPASKSLATLEQDRLPLRVRRQLAALLEGQFVEQAENVLAFGLPGRGKTHLCCAIARELVIHHGHRVLFAPATHLVQRLLVAKRDLRLEQTLKQLDRYDLVVLDDIGYIQQNRDEMDVLFLFISERYERKSLMITSNLVFSDWDNIFKNPVMTAAAIDRLVHHSIILELDGASYRMQHAKTHKQKEKNQ
jgi:DNA replication protein DnaC